MIVDQFQVTNSIFDSHETSISCISYVFSNKRLKVPLLRIAIQNNMPEQNTLKEQAVWNFTWSLVYSHFAYHVPSSPELHSSWSIQETFYR